MDLSDPDRFLEETNILRLVVLRHKDYKPTSHNQFSTWSYILVTQSFLTSFFLGVFFFLCFFDVWLNPGHFLDFFWWKTLLRSTRCGFFFLTTPPPKTGQKIGQIRVGEICSNSLIFTAECDIYTRTVYFSHEEQVGNEACDRQLFFSFRVFKVGEIVNISCCD